jgi:hypothetical protein
LTGIAHRSQARTVLACSTDLALAVIAGTKALDAAYGEAKKAPAARRHGNAGVDTGRGTDNTFGLGKLIAQRATSRRFV